MTGLRPAASTVANFFVSPEAREDLDQIHAYISEDNPEAANRVLEAALATFEDLAGMPGMGRDAGATESGRPYFVMELVKGTKITDYCDQNNLSTDARLDLFMEVCHALQHAHQKGIIHRDLKPSNVLVTVVDGQAVPKVIDFGIAKAMGQQLTDKTLFTRFEQMIGTPAYMSPEQAALSGVDIDTRSDIYSLGVLLYELLTGTTPVDRDTLKRAAVAVSITLALVTGLGVAVLGLNRARQERDRARQAETKTRQERDRALQAEAASEAVLTFFQERVLAATRPEGTEGGLGPGVTVRAAVNAAEPFISTSLAEQPVAEAKIRVVLGGTYSSLGDYERAIRQLERARFLLSAKFGSNHLETLNSVHWLAKTYSSAGRSQEAIPLLEQVLELYRVSLHPDDFRTSSALSDLATAYQKAGRVQEALPLFEENLEIAKARHGTAGAETFVAMNNLALIYHDAGRGEEALQMLQATLKGLKATLGPEHPNTFITMKNLGSACWKTGRQEDALPLFEEALRLSVAKLGPKHPNTLVNLENLAEAYSKLGYWSNAVEHYQTLTTEGPADIWNWAKGAVVAMAAVQTNLARVLSEDMAARFGTNRDENVRRWVVPTLTVVPASQANLALALTNADLLLVEKPEDLGNLTSKGILEYRHGNWMEAVKRLDPPWKDAKSRRGCAAGFFTAMAWHQLADTAEARKVLAEANLRLAGLLQEGELGDAWPAIVRNLLARAEAERLILGREVSPPVTAETLAAARRERTPVQSLDVVEERWKPVRQLLQRADAFARQTKWKEARDAYVGALAEPAFDWLAAEAQSELGCLALHIGVALVKSGDRENHERLSRRLLASDHGTLSPLTADRYSKTCLLGWRDLPSEVRLQALELARYAAGQDDRESTPASWWLCHTAGMAEYYAGGYRQALELLRHAENSNEIACRGGAMVFRAMALKQLGNEKEGAAVLKQAEEWLAQPLESRSGAKWWDLDICEISLNEARELFGQAVRK